jgi:hypothetical protein
MERDDMEYISALAALLIVMVFGGGLVIVAYLAFDDMRRRKVSFNSESIVAAINNLIRQLNALPTNALIMAGGVASAFVLIYLASNSGYFQSPPPAPTAAVSETAEPAAAPTAPAAEPAKAAAPAASGITRTLTSSSCASNGCPVSCSADEVMTSAYCLTTGGARLSDQLQVKNGVMTASCSSSTRGITVACARK